MKDTGPPDESPETGGELGRAIARARKRIDKGLEDPLPLGLVTGEPPAEEFGLAPSSAAIRRTALLGVVYALGLVVVLGIALAIVLSARDVLALIDLLVPAILGAIIGGPLLALSLFPPPLIPSVSIGVDGILVRGVFVPYARIRRVLHERVYHPGWGYGDASEGPENEWTVSVELGDEKPLVLLKNAYPHPPSHPAETPIDPDQDPAGSRLVRAIEAARTASGAREEGAGSEGVASELVMRGGRTGPEWVKALRRLGTAATTYRGVAADTDRLTRLLADAKASPSARAAAAVALKASGDRRTATRLRIAAGALANPRVRVALEEVADAADDEAVAAALLAVEEAERRG